MDAPRFQQLEQFFARAAGAPAEERSGILAEAAALDADVGQELARLLAVVPASALFGNLVQNAGASLLADRDRHERLAEPVPEPSRSGVEIGADPADPSSPASSPATELIERLAARLPTQSRYRIEGEVARGGMGAILRAFDLDLRRVLAMKVALASSASPADERQRARIGRFLEEAQITGQLDHPGIVPVHELGLDAQGRLYFTMRMVGGSDLVAIYELARKREEGWSTTRVLGVLLKVCEAVAYAHSKGVIHRDLKPANVMVGRFGEVYVMDWGLAKVVGQEDSRDLRVRAPASAAALQSIRSEERSADPSTPLVTMDGTVLGTPAYMSPEQASGDVAAMDVRSDVYALGAMLYQLFAGHAPYHEDGETLGAHRLWQKIARTPPVPLAALAPSTPPELVAIVERAMSRAMDERYPSMTVLAEDLRAYVEGRVVAAYETGSLAELRKWIGRNKALSVSLAAAGLAVAIGAVAFAIKADQATKAAQVAGIARADAEVERDAAEQFSVFLESLFQGANPDAKQEPSLFRILDDGYARLSTIDDRLVRARMMAVLGRVYGKLDKLPRGRELLESAIAIRREALGPDHLDVAVTLQDLTRTLWRLGDQVDAAEKAAREALRILSQRLGPDDPRVADAWSLCGEDRFYNKDYQGALDCLQAALDIRRRIHKEAHAELASSVANVGYALQRLGHLDQAEVFIHEALAMRRQLGDVPEILLTMEGLANLVWQRGDKLGSERVFAEVVRLAREGLRPGQPRLARTLIEYGQRVDHNRGPQAAEPLYREALEILREAYPDGVHLLLVECLTLLSSNLGKLGRQDEMRDMLRAAVDAAVKTRGADHADTVRLRLALEEATAKAAEPKSGESRDPNR